MEDLITWLRAQLDEDERVARRAGADQPRWSYQRESFTVFAAAVGGRQAYPVAARKGASSPLNDVDGEHIVRWDPARVLAEVDAKRRILDEHRPIAADDVPGLTQCSLDAEVMPCDHVRLLAMPYADRPGYPG